MKNIPTSNKKAYIKEYTKKLLLKTENLLRRMQWKAHFCLNPNAPRKDFETYGFNTPYAPPPVKEFEPFRDEVLEMVRNVEFGQVDNDFQSQLRMDTEKIKNTKEVIVKADKTRNWYKVPATEYEKLLQEAITKQYKKVDVEIMDKTNKETAEIARKLQLADRMEVYTKSDAYITLKDHKEDWPGKISTRLINGAKTDLGKIAHKILKTLNSEVAKHTKTNHWKSTQEVIVWFNKIENREKCKFLKFDICEFYPSITQDLLLKALKWAGKFHDIGEEKTNIILQARKTFLFKDGIPWVKKHHNENFDVPMGCWDGAECCEIIGLYMLHRLTQNGFRIADLGLYRDDGLLLIRGSGRTGEKTKQKLSAIFTENGLKITTETCVTATDYLDVYFNLEEGSYRPYRKPNDRPLYIHKKSNHPRTIIKKLPKMISTRLSVLSCTKEVFDEASGEYVDALKRSGYNDQDLSEFKYQTPTDKKKKRKRMRHVTWYNPPFCLSVKTDIGRRFLNLVKKHFPKKHPLHKAFNKNTVKVSYSNMRNIKAYIDKHNRTILTPPKPVNKNTCNCRKSRMADCPLQGKCLQESLVYQADVIPTNTDQNNNNPIIGTKTYYGNTGRTFKKRYYEHLETLNNKNSKKQTTLSKYCWQLKAKNIAHKIKWSIKSKAFPYQGGARYCDLCLEEKFIILMAPKDKTINARSEIMSKCRHKWKFSLESVK